MRHHVVIVVSLRQNFSDVGNVGEVIRERVGPRMKIGSTSWHACTHKLTHTHTHTHTCWGHKTASFTESTQSKCHVCAGQATYPPNRHNIVVILIIHQLPRQTVTRKNAAARRFCNV